MGFSASYWEVSKLIPYIDISSKDISDIGRIKVFLLAPKTQSAELRYMYIRNQGYYSVLSPNVQFDLLCKSLVLFPCPTVPSWSGSTQCIHQTDK